jgi:putative ABC transport system permease protein
VAVINRAMAEHFWPGSEPIGRRINPTRLRARYASAETWIEIVGVVEDVKYGAIEEPAGPTLYLSAWQPALTPDSLSIRTAGDPTAVVAAVRREVRALDPGVPIYRITTLRERASQATSRYRFSALLMSLFAGLAVLLAGVGIYGVMAYSVSQRTRELGIRVALGAQQREIFRLVIVDGAVLTLVGLGLGLVAARAATRVLTSQLYQVRATDPMTFAAVALLLTVVALVACYIPARRAAKVDPMVALRYE